MSVTVFMPECFEGLRFACVAPSVVRICAGRQNRPFKGRLICSCKGLIPGNPARERHVSPRHFPPPSQLGDGPVHRTVRPVISFRAFVFRTSPMTAASCAPGVLTTSPEHSGQGDCPSAPLPMSSPKTIRMKRKKWRNCASDTSRH